MSEYLQLTAPQLRRLGAWKIALGDASSYLAIARTHEEIIDQNTFIEHGTGETRIGHALEKGLVAAAIISVSQLTVRGEGNNDISSNKKSGSIGEIYAALHGHSDRKNGWEAGRTKTLLEQEVRSQRHTFLAHCNGSKAAIRPIDNADPLSFSWRPPNPWYRADAFSELEASITAMHEMLSRIISDQSKALRDTPQDN